MGLEIMTIFLLTVRSSEFLLECLIADRNYAPNRKKSSCQEHGMHNLSGFSIVTSPYC